MKIKNINVGNENIKPEEITRKSRAIITDNQGRILIGNYGGVYLLPGGSIDKKENPNEAIIRELKEEVGLKLSKLTPFIKMKYYQSNYPKRDEKIINRLVINYIYIGKETDGVKCKTNLTEKEKKDKFSLKYYSLEEIDKILEEKNENPRAKYFNEELRIIINKYKEEKILKEPKKKILKL